MVMTASIRGVVWNMISIIVEQAEFDRGR